MAATADVQILRLPGGLELTVPDGETVDSTFWKHAGLSVSEGMCPHHQSPLEPVTIAPGSDVAVGTHCKTCRAYWSLSRDHRVSWDIDYDPHQGTPLIPEWVA